MKPEVKSTLISAGTTALYILITITLAVALAFGVFNFYKNYEFELEQDDITYIELDLTKDSFTGQFRSDVKSRKVCGIEYEIIDGNLYITVLATANPQKALPTNKDGYATLEINDIEKCYKVFYRGEKKDTELNA